MKGLVKPAAARKPDETIKDYQVIDLHHISFPKACAKYQTRFEPIYYELRGFESHPSHQKELI
jgi:hypothetical protein